MSFFVRKEARSTCPVCAYPHAYTETTGRTGKRIGWCASCQNQEAIAAHLRSSGGGDYRPVASRAADADKAAEAAYKRRRAQDLWNGAVPITNDDPAGRYLALRALPELIGNPALRYRGDVPHPTGGSYPAMLALVRDVAGNAIALHRTYLTATGCKATLDPVKASLAPIMGGGIYLGPIAEEVVVAEGIETAASAGLLLGLPAVAGISAGNMATALKLPARVRKVVIAADDDGFDVIGRNPGIEAAEAAYHRLRAEGREVCIGKTGQPGFDFNNLLMKQRAAGRGVAQ